MRGVSKRPWLAMLMSTPSPGRRRTAHSATTAPMTASVTPTRRPPKMTGSADGISRRRVRWAEVAPRLRNISSSSGSVERMPTIVAIVIGKKTMSAQITTRAARPPPNQMSSSGASARIGIGLGGDDVRATGLARRRGDLPSAIPVPMASGRADDEAEDDLEQRGARGAPTGRQRRWPGSPRSDDLRRRQDVRRVVADDGHELPHHEEDATRLTQGRRTRLMPHPPRRRPRSQLERRGRDASAVPDLGGDGGAARRRPSTTAGRGRGRSTSTTRATRPGRGVMTTTRSASSDGLGDAVGDEDDGAAAARARGAGARRRTPRGSGRRAR